MKVKKNYSLESSDDAQDTEIGEKHISCNFLDIRSTAIVIGV